MTASTKESVKFTCVNIIGSIFPIILFYIALCFKLDKLLPFEKISNRGDILIIGISLIISSCYSLYILKKDSGSNGSTGTVFWISIFIIVITTFLYALLLSETTISGPESIIIQVYSIVIFLWCTYIVYVAQYYNTLNPSVTKKRKEQVDILGAKFEKLSSATGAKR